MAILFVGRRNGRAFEGWRLMPLAAMMAISPHLALGQSDSLKQAEQLTAQANELVEKGDLVRAEALFKRALAIDERALGPEHADVAVSLNNLAVLYQNEGRYADAEPIYKRTLAILEKTLGPDDPTSPRSSLA